MANAITVLVLALVLAETAANNAANQATPTMLDQPPRYMWGWGPGLSGYCGSASLQTAAIYHGNWLTEDAIRGTSGSHDGRHELLIVYPKDEGVPGTALSSACKALKLRCTMWSYDQEPAPQHGGFLSWTRAHLDAGLPVIAGLYWGVEDDSDYDHIVPVVGYEADGPTSVAAVYFNDLYTNVSIRAAVSDFVSTREQCNSPERFGPDSFCLPRDYDYGLVVSGNEDVRGVLRPVRLAMDSWTEPDYSREDGHHESPVPLHASATASNLTVGSRYGLLRFDSADAVPAEDFLQARYASKLEFVASGDTWTTRVTFMSNTTQYYRCVPIDSTAVTPAPAAPVPPLAPPVDVSGSDWLANAGPLPPAPTGHDAHMEIQYGASLFTHGKVTASVDAFDTAMGWDGRVNGTLWQRGLSLFYTEQLAEAAAQFQLDVAGNPDDTEESIWRFLAQARELGVPYAAAHLLNTTGETRPYMMTIYAMYKTRTPEAEDDVLALCSPEAQGSQSAFYADMYYGLYMEANGDADLAEAHLRTAGLSAYGSSSDYMWWLTRVHNAVRGWPIVP